MSVMETGKRRTIAILSDMQPSGGGSHQWALNIFHVLEAYRAARGDVDVHFLHYHRYPGPNPMAKIFPDFRYVTLGPVREFIARFFRRFSVFFPSAMAWLAPFFPLNRVLKRLNPDLTIFPVPTMDVPLCNRRYLFCMADIAHVYYPHFREIRRRGGLRMRAVLFGYGARNAWRVMLESTELRREMARHYQMDPAKGVVVYQVLPRLFSASEMPIGEPTITGRYLFYPAQLWEHKNHCNLLRALALLLKEFPDLQLVLCGTRYPGWEEIFALADELGISDKIKYLGYVPDADMPQLYRNAAALVMPTYFGPTNIPTLEAFAFDCPAVISGLPGVEEQVKDAALRFDPDSPKDMAAKLRIVLTDRGECARLRAAGHARIAELSYEYYQREWFALLDSAWPETGR
jgi:glycosyltransferase involved in cell wall biosynthesis